jgi:hypothetical protein
MTESHFGDEAAWKAAREAARDDVRAALAPRRRTCPSCGRVDSGTGRTCPACGGDFVVRRSRRPSRRAVLAVAGGLAVVAAVTAAIVPGLRDAADEQRRADAAAQARLEASERARLRAEVAPRTAMGPARRDGEAPLAYRARLLSAGQAAVTADARRRVAEGTIAGPVAGTECTVWPRTAPRRDLEADPATPAGRYHCIAYERRFELSELEGEKRTGIIGAPYWLVVDYGTARMTFCKFSPRAGEGGTTLAQVRTPAGCLDPLRRR